MTFSPRARTTFDALLHAALPAGRLFPPANASTLERLERQVESLGPTPSGFIDRVLAALDATTMLTHRRHFADLTFGARLDVLDRWHEHEPTRLALRALLIAAKAAHFDDPRLFQSLGCVYQVTPPAKLATPRWREQVVDAATLEPSDPVDCDVVIVGTGAGGAPLAYELARQGHAVALLEEGHYYDRSHFTGRPVDMVRKFYRNSGTTIALGNAAIPVPVGRAVGGTTLVNAGTCFRVPEQVLAEWRGLGLDELTAQALAPYYEHAEQVLGVAPSPRAVLGKTAELIARGCDAFGYSHHPLARNAPGCDGQGICCFGCPTGAKQSTDVSWVPMALERGATLFTGFKVEQIERDRLGRATGVSGATSTGRRSVRAKVVVLACGSLLTPVLLEQNDIGNTSGQRGKNLSIHPAAAAVALFDEDVNGDTSVPQGYAIDHFVNEGLYFEGAAVPLQVTAMVLPGYGPAFVSLLEQFRRTLHFGFMVKDTSRGSVRAGADGQPRLSYWLNDADLKRAQRGFSILARVFFAAGAREVNLPVYKHERVRSERDLAAFESAHISARHIDFSAYHPLGTARMGVDPLTSVVSPTHEVHDVTNLFICDGSVMPSSLGVNPQLTIMALSLRAASFIDDRLRRLARRAA